jgi:hypothetical protein
MLAVRPVQVVSNQVVGVAIVWHRLMPASGAVLVVLGVFATGVLRSAWGAIRLGRLDRTLVDVALVAVMQVSIVQIVGVAGVLNRAMPTSGAVRVIMPFVLRVIHFARLLRLV